MSAKSRKSLRKDLGLPKDWTCSSYNLPRPKRTWTRPTASCWRRAWAKALERNQQSERLQVLEQPVVPQKPIKPNRPKLLALVFVLALFVGVGAAMTAESMDKSIHSTQELTGVIDSSLIVAIPYITTQAETLRRKGRVRLLLGGVILLALAAIAMALYLGLSIDLSSWVDQSWLDRLTRLSK